MARNARTALTLVLAWIGWRAFHHEYGYIPLLSDVDTAIHEFGHVLFMPFGETMAILGGSLTQVALPAVFAAYFLRTRDERRDVYAASVCLWWVSVNLLGVAVYANDARAGRLMLLTGATGQESDAHDWYNLFAHWGVLHRDTVIAGHMRRTAWLLFLLSVVFGIAAAWRRAAPPPAEGEEPGSTGAAGAAPIGADG